MIDTVNNMDEYLKRQAAEAQGGQANPVSGLPTQPTGEQKTTVSANVPIPTGTEAPAPKQVMQSNVPIPQSGDVPEVKPFETEVGNNVASYLAKTSSNLSGDPGYTTEAGRLAAERVTNGLKTPDASSVNAQNTEDTAASRRAYLARVQADESIGQSGFGAGTAQADRIRTTSAAGVNQANQAGQSGVNAYLRQRTEDNLNRAQGLESSQYNKGRDNLSDSIQYDERMNSRNETSIDRRLAAAATAYGKSRDLIGDERYTSETAYNQGRDAIGDARIDRAYTDSRTDKALDNSRWDTLNAQQQAQLAVENAAVASGKDDTAKRNLLAGLPDGPAKNKVMAGLADGSLTLQNALNSVMNPDGTIKDEYRGSTPGALGLEAEKEYAEQTVSLQDPSLKLSNPQEYEKRVNAEILANRSATNEPVNKAKEASELEDIKAKMDTGKSLEDTENQAAIEGGLIPPLTSTTLPFGGRAVTQFKTTNPSGKAAINGKVVEIIGGGRYTSTYGGAYGTRHTDTVNVRVDGKEYWVDSKGSWYAKNPVSYERNGEFKGGSNTIPSPVG